MTRVTPPDPRVRGDDGHTPVLLFDIGGVLVENVAFIRLRELWPEPVDLATLKAAWLRSRATHRFETGLGTAEAFAAEVVDEWRLNCTADAFLAEFPGWAKGWYPGAVALVTRLRRTHRVGCLANSNALHWAKLDGFDTLFDVALSSHEIGLMKPDPACFDYAVARCGVEPSDVIFFDDAAPNVEAALRAGMRAHRVDGPDAIADCLAREGVGSIT